MTRLAAALKSFEDEEGDGESREGARAVVRAVNGMALSDLQEHRDELVDVLTMIFLRGWDVKKNSQSLAVEVSEVLRSVVYNSEV